MRIRHAILLLVFIGAIFSKRAHGQETNVLTYYAISNSIDGQPMLDLINVFRFIPVYTYRDDIDTVIVTIYYGPNIYTKQAIKDPDGKYWEIVLPKFDFNQSIQRYEVESRMKVNSILTKQITCSEKAINSFCENFDKITHIKDNIKIYSNESAIGLKHIPNFTKINLEDNSLLVKRVDGMLAKIDFTRKVFDSINSKIFNFADTIDRPLISRYSQCAYESFKDKDSIKNLLDKIFVANNSLDSQVKYTNDSILSAINKNSTLKFFFGRLDEDFVIVNSFFSKEDSLIKEIRQNNIEYVDKLKDEILNNLLDTGYSGSGVQAGDIKLYCNNTKAAILYRNYNPENRRLPALEPGERVSIYRIRYIPFPIIGDKLSGPFEKNIPIVFEAGISFGNITVSSNDNIVSQFSFQRFGICMAFTPQLFSEKAQIKALALSYDFNAYASVAFGANFGTLSNSRLGSYASLGINFRAFQILMRNASNIFK